MLKQTPRLTSIANIALFRLFNRDLFGNLNNLYRTVTRTRGRLCCTSTCYTATG